MSLTVGVSLFVAGLALTTVRRRNIRAFTVGVCAGAASLSHYAVIGISTIAGAGLLLLILAPICGLIGLTAGILLGAYVAGTKFAVDEPATE